MMTDVLHVGAFQDNYIWLIPGKAAGRVAIVDPGDADPVITRLEHDGLEPVAVLCTHHHGDHVGGVEDLVRRYPMPVYGPRAERVRGLTHRLGEGDRVVLDALALEFAVLDIPGHTSGHIAFHGHGMLFCGDTLFSAGCGRLFEGTAEQMHDSLGKLRRLPPETKIYCGHEYTVANLRFAQTVEPGNADVIEYLERAQALRAKDLATLPSTIALERRVNPFLRADVPAIKTAAERSAGKALASPVEVFAVLRRWKDGFRG